MLRIWHGSFEHGESALVVEGRQFWGLMPYAEATGMVIEDGATLPILWYSVLYSSPVAMEADAVFVRLPHLLPVFA